MLSTSLKKHKEINILNCLHLSYYKTNNKQKKGNILTNNSSYHQVNKVIYSVIRYKKGLDTQPSLGLLHLLYFSLKCVLHSPWLLQDALALPLNPEVPHSLSRFFMKLKTVVVYFFYSVYFSSFISLDILALLILF